MLNSLRKGVMKQVELASLTGLSPTTIQKLCKGTTDFTLHVARVIERAGFGKATQWMDLQAKYDATRTDDKRTWNYPRPTRPSR